MLDIAGPSRLRAAGGRVAFLAAAGAAVTIDPFHTRTGPDCPLLHYTGWACPLCGPRAMSALVHGHVATAARLNVAIVALVGLALVLRGDHPRLARIDRRHLGFGVGGALLAFMVVRNVVGGWWLPPAFAG